jgi:hypothetical protein
MAGEGVVVGVLEGMGKGVAVSTNSARMSKSSVGVYAGRGVVVGSFTGLVTGGYVTGVINGKPAVGVDNGVGIAQAANNKLARIQMLQFLCFMIVCTTSAYVLELPHSFKAMSP